MKLSISIIFCLISLRASAQLQDPLGYYDTVQEASLQLHTGNYQASVSLYDQALTREQNPFSFDFKNAIIASWLLQDSTRAMDLLYDYMQTYGEVPTQDTDIKDMVLACESTRLLRNRQISQDKFDKVWVAVIDSLIAIDQLIRTRDYATGTIYHEGYNIDSLNTLELLTRISERGFPTEQRVGSDRAFRVSTLFLHADFDKENALLGELLKDFVLSGHYDPRRYAAMIDRRQMMYGRKPTYYQIPIGFEELNAQAQADVNQQRKEIGLGKVSETVTWRTLPNGDLKISHH